MQITNCTFSQNSPGLNAPGKKESSTRYQNDTGKELDMSFTDTVSTSWKFLFTRNNRTPGTELPVKQVDLSHFNNQGSKQLNATWLGHSSVMLNMDGYKILVDPVFEKRVSFFGPSRFNGEVPLDISKIQEVDAVIISHDHYDHLNKFSIQHLIKKSQMFIVPMGVGSRLMKWGVPQNKIIELGWWQEHRIDKKLMVAATPAQHFSGRGITDRNKTLWASWVVQTPFHRIFFSGDSGYFNGFKQIGDVYGPFDMTFIECGAYNEAWPVVHMFPEETVQAHLDLKGNVLHPIHWGTFNLSLHSWYDPMVRVTAAAKEEGVNVATPIVGDTTIFDKRLPVTRWWEEAMELSCRMNKGFLYKGEGYAISNSSEKRG